MRAVIQRVKNASVTIDKKLFSEIDEGFLVLIGFEINDNSDEMDWLCKKIAGLRIFNDNQGLMNKSLTDINGDILVVSQFTLMGSTKKGNRPSFIKSARAEEAIPLYEKFCATLSQLIKKPVKTGLFGADMKINLLNDGPVTIIIDTNLKE